MGYSIDPSEPTREELLRVAYRLLGNVAESEDVVQEVLLRRLMHTGPAPEHPHAWLARAIRNLAIDGWRRTRLEQERLGQVLSIAEAGAPAPDMEVQRRQTCRQAISVLLAACSADEVAAILLREVFGFTYAEIVHAGGGNEAAWRQALRRALERARECARNGVPCTDHEVMPATTAEADAVLDRFAHAVQSGNRAALLYALQVAARGADAAEAESLAVGIQYCSTARLRVDVDACGARVTLVAFDTALCTVLPVRSAESPRRGNGRSAVDPIQPSQRRRFA